MSLKTAQRWKRGQSVAPETAIVLLRLKWHGDLAVIGEEWAGWTYHSGILISPDGWRVSRNDALAVPLLLGQVHALRQKLSALEAHNEDGLEEQPDPGEIPHIITA